MGSKFQVLSFSSLLGLATKRPVSISKLENKHRLFLNVGDNSWQWKALIDRFPYLNLLTHPFWSGIPKPFMLDYHGCPDSQSVRTLIPPSYQAKSTKPKQLMKSSATAAIVVMITTVSPKDRSRTSRRACAMSAQPPTRAIKMFTTARVVMVWAKSLSKTSMS